MAAAHRAAAYVRRESRPFLLECETTRLGKHKQGQGDLRTKEEIATLAERDPLRNISVDSETRQALEIQINEIIEAVLKSADPVLKKESV